MAMIINNNFSAQMVLGEMQKNNNKLDKTARQAASGIKIGGAGDGASEYSISEKMRVQIRGLEQDIANAQTGTNLIKTAEEGIQEIINNLRSLKELALNAANDHNTDLDRETIQKEVDSRLATIDDIAATTNYNGRILLNGHYTQYINPTISNNTGSGGISGITEPTGTPTIIQSGSSYTINTAGVYSIANTFHGTINIANGLSGVKIQQASSGTLTEVYINGPSSGNANLWLDGLNIENQQPQSWIRFSGSNNNLTTKGTNTYTNNFFGGTYTSAVINIGNGLTLQGSGTLNINQYRILGAVIGTDYNENNPSADLIINSGNYNITVVNDSRTNPVSGGAEGALVGSGSSSTMGNIIINGGSFDLYQAGGGAAIGSGSSGFAKNIIIKHANVTALTDDGACIGSGLFVNMSGTATATVGDILIEDSIINVECKHLYNKNYPLYNDGEGAGIGSGGIGSDAGNITIRNSTVNAASKYGAGIGSGQKSHAGNITIENSTVTATSQYGENIGKGLDGTIGNININSSSNAPLESEELGTPLIIHTGTKANQHLRVFINSMDTDTLGIDPLPVNPRDAAVTALDRIDRAINYSLNENTRMGAYQTELSYTIANLTTASENTQSSESVIRDADIAKTMMDHAKYNILSQSAQAMLAQANQNSNGVLSLLQ